MNGKYCLDANFFIEGWNKYYSPDFCFGYWDIIAELGKNGIVFLPSEVKKEIDKIDDKVKDWLKKKSFMVKNIDDRVQQCIKDIYSKNSLHLRLTDSSKNRSLADAWVIAHAMAENATVVTKENKITSQITNKIKIPNVCENMGVRWIDDFTFIKELQITFDCKINQSTIKPVKNGELFSY